MTESLLQHQKKQLTAIRSLISDTSTEEKTLRERVESNRGDAEQKRIASAETCEEAFTALREEALLQKEKSLADVQQRRELEPSILKEKHQHRIIEINSNAEEIREETEKKLCEATWLAESVYEGAIPVPRKKSQDAQTVLDDAKDQIDAMREEAPAMLSRLRQKLTLAESDSSAIVDKSMSEYAQGAHIALGAIRSDPRANWFVGFRPAMFVGIVTIAAVAGAGAYTHWEMTFPFFAIPVGAMAIAALTLVTTFASGRNSIGKKYKEFALCVQLATQTYDFSMKSIDEKRRAEEKVITANRDSEINKAEQKYKPQLEEVDRLLKKDLEKEKKRFSAVAEKLVIKLEQDSNEATLTFDSAMKQSDKDEFDKKKQIEASYTDSIDSINEDERSTMQRLEDRWNKELTAFRADVDGQCAATALDHQPWDSNWSSWQPPTVASGHIPIGFFNVDLTTVGGTVPVSSELQLGNETAISLPLSSTLPRDVSILITSSGKERGKSIALLQNAMLRVLTAVPPGKAKFMLLDPVGLGQSFAGVLHLADYEESQLLDRAWTEPRHIETQLARLTEHMETVIQKYLRNEFDSIDEYNEQAGEIAEPYRFLVIADFPNNFSENATKRLVSIITSGAQCGVHVIIHRDVSLVLPSGIDEDTLRRIPLRVVEEDGVFCIDEDELRNLPLTLEPPPNETTTTTIVKMVGDTAEQTHRVEVPFSVIAPSKDEIWSLSTTDKVAIPLGRSGATKLQNLTLGRGTAQHALIAGKTGSGKSTLLHVLITNIAMWYSPDEVEFYLVDFKKGVEFKTYATHKLPHARVVAVESDREFGVSVLQRIDAELKRRGELFRDLGVQDIAGFREKSSDIMPRILLIVDEFQEFFIDDDRVAQEASLLLDRLVRQGRAFGIHAIMGSQTLDGAYTLSRSTMGQMAVRVALQCSEADSYIILNEDNAAARLLSRPGEAIYNDAAGNIEGNSPFQIVWLDEHMREDLLADLVSRDGKKKREMVVYEGNQSVFLKDNKAFQQAAKDSKPLAASAWLGGAMAIKEDTAATFRAASASNLLVVGQQEETITSMVASALFSLDKQFGDTDASFIMLDGTPADSGHAGILETACNAMGCSTTLVGVRDIAQAMADLDVELQKRMRDGAANTASIFLVINALHRYRDLRRDEDDYGFGLGNEDKTKTPSQVLAELLKEGPPLGMHVIVTTDTLANLSRAFDRQGIREFDMRVLLQMGANDSTNLIDAPDASKLGMHRALLYSEETGTIEPFRPYALPDQ